MYNAGNFEPNVVLKLNYPKWSSIYDNLISGSLESVVSDKDDGENYFDAIMVLTFSVKHSYGYTFVGEDRMSSFPSSVESGESIGLSNLNDSNGGLCRLLGNRLERFELVYGSECGGGVNCNPLGGDVGYVPSSLRIAIDELTDFRTSWDIKATPTFFFLRDGQQVDKLVGANKVELQKKIVAIVDSTPCKK
ncbi:PREDICTED: uncharacterized protein LOC101306570 [Fragaria vesca subsp. vesca]